MTDEIDLKLANQMAKADGEEEIDLKQTFDTLTRSKGLIIIFKHIIMDLIYR